MAEDVGAHDSRTRDQKCFKTLQMLQKALHV